VIEIHAFFLPSFSILALFFFSMLALLGRRCEVHPSKIFYLSPTIEIKNAFTLGVRDSSVESLNIMLVV